MIQYIKTQKEIFFYISYTLMEELRRFDDWTSGRRGRGKYQTSAILLSIRGKGNVLVHVVHPGSRCHGHRAKVEKCWKLKFWFS